MLSSLFESRNQQQLQQNNKSNKKQKNKNQVQSVKPIPQPLFDLTPKVIQPVIKSNHHENKQSNIQEEINNKNNKKSIIQPIKPQSTIFVGNVNLETKHNQLKKHFEKYGTIQKLWFRSIPVQPSKIGRKAGYILNKFIQGSNSMNAYIRFSEKQSALTACKQLNGKQFKNLTLRVSPSDQKVQDTEHTIFVGNLSHDIKEEELRQHFKSVGKIQSVRVIKSRQTNKGIGIGYVRFQTKQCMKQAIDKLNGSKLLEREIRIKKAVQKDRLQKKQKKLQTKFGKKYNKGGKNKKPNANHINKNSKAIEIRQKSKEIKDNRNIIKKTKMIKK